MENKWISVKERLPDQMEAITISKHVIVACKNHPSEGGHFIRTLYFDHKTGMWYINWNNSVAWEVTHWMLLPLPPKE